MVPAARVFFVASLGLAITGACGGTTQNIGGSGDGGGTDGSDSSTGADAPGADASSSDASGKDAVSQVDGGSVGPVQCGPQTCNAPQICCVDTQQRTAQCQDPSQNCDGFPITCSSAQSCQNGNVCCGSYSQQDGVSTDCQAAPCPTGFGNFQLCATDQECPPGETCRPLQQGAHVCRPPFDGGTKDGGGFVDAQPPADAGGAG